MRTLPFLLITLHFSQIGFTDDLTFTGILLSSIALPLVSLLCVPLKLHNEIKAPKNVLTYYSITNITTSILFLFIFINFTDFHELLRIKYREGGVFKEEEKTQSYKRNI